MGWQEKREQYKRLGKVGKQKVDDLVCRRILHGLGIVEAKLPDLERAEFGETYFDDTLKTRVFRVLLHLARKRGSPIIKADKQLAIVEWNGKSPDTIVDLIQEWLAAGPCPVLFTRYGDERAATVFFGVWLEDLPKLIKSKALKPEFKIVDLVYLGEHEEIGACVIQQDIESFIKNAIPDY